MSTAGQNITITHTPNAKRIYFPYPVYLPPNKKHGMIRSFLFFIRRYSAVIGVSEI